MRNIKDKSKCVHRLLTPKAQLMCLNGDRSDLCITEEECKNCLCADAGMREPMPIGASYD